MPKAARRIVTKRGKTAASEAISTKRKVTTAPLSLSERYCLFMRAKSRFSLLKQKASSSNQASKPRLGPPTNKQQASLANSGTVTKKKAAAAAKPVPSIKNKKAKKSVVVTSAKSKVASKKAAVKTKKTAKRAAKKPQESASKEDLDRDLDMIMTKVNPDAVVGNLNAELDEVCVYP